MNIKRYIAMVVVGVIFAFGFDFGVHQKFLVAVYEETPELWRPQEGMEAYCSYYLGYLVLVVALVGFIFTRNYEGKGLGEGIRFGLYLGAFAGLNAAVMVCYMPISWFLAGAWFAATLVQMVGLGVIFSLIYKEK